MKKDLYSEKAITLIALIITIIVILILAGVSISTIRNSGTVDKAKEQTFKAALSAIKEDYEVSKLVFDDDNAIDINAGLTIQDLVRGYSQYEMNCQDGVSLIYTIDGALGEDYSILQRMEEILKQSCNGTISAVDRKAIHDELEQLVSEINRISEQALFNDEQILNEDKARKIYYEKNDYFEIEYKNTTAEALNIKIDNNSEYDSESSLATVQSAMQEIVSRRAYYENLRKSLENKSDELAKRTTLLMKYDYLDEIKLGKISNNGQDESATIENIDKIIGNISGIGTLDVKCLKNEVSNLETYIKNAGDVISIVQEAEGGAGEIHSILQRMNELAVGCANNNYGNTDRTAIQTEINQLIEEIDLISNNTMFNNDKLLDGSYNKNFTIGAGGATVELTINSCSSAKIGENNGPIYANVSTIENSKKTLDSINTAIGNISNIRSTLGAKQNTMEHTINNLENIKENLQSSIEYGSSNNQVGTDNFGGAISTVQVAEGALNEIHSILQRINEVVVHAANATNDDNDRLSMQTEINDLKLSIDRIANSTIYGGRTLLDGTYSLSHTIGIYGEKLEIQINNCSTSGIVSLNSDVLTVEKALQLEKEVKLAIRNIGIERNKLGAIQNRLEHTAYYHELIKDVLNSRVANQTKKDLRLSLAGLEEMQSILTRIRQLYIQARNFTMAYEEKIACYDEIVQLLQEIDRIANNTKSGEIVLLNGQYDRNTNVTVSALGLNGITLESILSPVDATEQLDKLETAIKNVFKLRKELAIKEGSYKARSGEFAIDSSMASKLKVQNGELVYIGKDKKEKAWAQELGIQVGY